MARGSVQGSDSAAGTGPALGRCGKVCVEVAESGILHVVTTRPRHTLGNRIPGCTFLVAADPGSPFLSLGRVL